MPFIKIMGKKDNKKKVKKANVKEFPVDSALDRCKKIVNLEMLIFVLIIVFDIKDIRIIDNALFRRCVCCGSRGRVFYGKQRCRPCPTQIYEDGIV